MLSTYTVNTRCGSKISITLLGSKALIWSDNVNGREISQGLFCSAYLMGMPGYFKHVIHCTDRFVDAHCSARSWQYIAVADAHNFLVERLLRLDRDCMLAPADIAPAVLDFPIAPSSCLLQVLGANSEEESLQAKYNLYMQAMLNLPNLPQELHSSLPWYRHVLKEHYAIYDRLVRARSPFISANS